MFLPIIGLLYDYAVVTWVHEENVDLLHYAVGLLRVYPSQRRIDAAWYQYVLTGVALDLIGV